MFAALAQQLRAYAPNGQLHADSRRVQAGDIFFAYPSETGDGRHFVADAIARGASAVVFEAAGFEWQHGATPHYALDNLRQHTGEIAAVFYGQPGADLLTVAVTGTNGKTTCSSWLAQALAKLNKKCALVGTLGAGFSGALHSTGYTTPDAVQLQQRLAQLRSEGAQALAIEASSIGLDQDRLNGLAIKVAVFTNLSRDHLDYHGSMQAYEAAKARLFSWPGLQGASINADDPAGQRFLERSAHLPKIIAWSLNPASQANVQVNLSVRDLQIRTDGLAFEVVYRGASEQRASVQLNVLGEYNVANWLACCGALLAAGFSFDAAVDALREVQPAPGRLQIVEWQADKQTPHRSNAARSSINELHSVAAPLVVVDYAHTPDALEQALRALRPVTQARGGKLVCVFGCGGNRDAGKRPQMAAVSATFADCTVLTSDNPRDENPLHIIEQMQAGLPSGAAYAIEVERATAIERAIQEANENDVILLAGKGHERTQEIAGVQHPFYDPDIAQAALQQRAASTPAEATC